MKVLSILFMTLVTGCAIDAEEGVDVPVDETESELTASPACAETCGDVNADKKITVTDSVLVGRWAAGLDHPTTCQLKAADVNGSGAVTVTDQVLVQRGAAGLEDSRTFKCPSPIQFGPLTKIPAK